MTPNDFKKKVTEWIELQGYSLKDRLVRVYKTRRYGLEVRVYIAPMEYVSNRVSFRQTDEPTFEGNIRTKHGTRGHHTIRTPMYLYVNEENFSNEEDMEFLKEELKDNL